MTFIFCMHFICISQVMPISYIFQLRQHSPRPLCALIITVNTFDNWYIALLIVSWLWSQLSSLTERTSDDQLWIPLAKYDVPQFAIPVYQIVAFFVENKTAVKIDILIVAHWLNILSNCGGVSNGVIAISATLTSCGCLPAFSYTGVYRPRKLASE